MASNLDTLNNFLDTINKPNNAGWQHYHDIDHLLSLFCEDNGNHPYVGITLRGPQFPNRANIRILFTQLLKTTFPDMAWKPENNLRMTDGNTIAVEVQVTGTQQATWFQDKFKSPPLSQIDHDTVHRLAPNNNKMDIPACMVFTFDGRHKIQQLAIYMDRYKMMDQLAPREWTSILLPEKTHPIAAAGGVTVAGPTPGRKIMIMIEG
ncbi:MAG: nuclear transport factor 2 family protein [Bradyrhizobium sp.]|nr:nuclear transport factor 2 family protein [Bradyrhizobium sp.]